MPFITYRDKKVFFHGAGKGDFLLLLHGDTVSSKMLGGEYNYYKKRFRVFTFDYPGHGKSEKTCEFPVDLWNDTAKCAIEICKATGVKKLNIIGTDGGAQVALNMALEAPGLVNRVIADSFLGFEISPARADAVIAGRKEAGKYRSMRFAWFLQHGFKWKTVVKNCNEQLKKFASSGGKYFRRDLSNIKAPVLFTGSMTDEMFPDMENMIQAALKKNSLFTSHLFETGAHMTMVSRRYEFRALAMEYLRKK
jgi:pimeloyl-ACP methyl ester carboxylesterase